MNYISNFNQVFVVRSGTTLKKTKISKENKDHDEYISKLIDDNRNNDGSISLNIEILDDK